MAESIQKILKQRALEGQHPTQPQQIIDWFEAVAEVWNQHPTAFEWGGKRAIASALRHTYENVIVWGLLELVFVILSVDASQFLRNGDVHDK